MTFKYTTENYFGVSTQQELIQNADKQIIITLRANDFNYMVLQQCPI